MENNENQNPTQSEQASPDPLDESFDGVMKLLSNLPTDRAMKELLSKRIGPAITQVIETMALQKSDLVRIMVQIHKRERCLMRIMEAQKLADQAIKDWIDKNPNYRIEAIPVDENGNDKKD